MLMIIKYNTEQLKRIIESIFYLTGVRISILDTDYNVIVNCTQKQDYCSLLQTIKDQKARCLRCDQKILKRCQSTKKMEYHICWAGLYDCSLPIIKNNSIVGFAIMGRIRSERSPVLPQILPAKSKNIIIIVTAVILTVVFLICFIPKLIEIIKFESEIPDLNGPDNYSLATLTESDILEDYGSRMLMTGTSKQCEKTNVKGIYEDDDRDEVSSHAKIFDGVYTAQATKISGDALTFNISSVVKSGNFAIYILIDGEIYCQADINCNTEISLDNIKNKIVLVKIVGEGADFEFKIKRIIS